MTLSEAEKILANAGIEDSRHEARIIFAVIGGEPLYKLLTPSYSTVSKETISAIYRRAEREPLAYIIGNIDFYNENYIVSPDCLIPRADTELLVDLAVHLIPEGEKFLDIGTGSGCIALSTLNNTKNTTAIAVDISEGALSLAKRNAENLGLSERVEFVVADAMKGPVTDRAFALLSNPPYVSNECYKTLEPEIFKEPVSAFVGGIDGGDFYRTLTPMYRDIIDKNGFIAYEIGFDQGDMIREIAKENRMSCKIYKDLGGRDRVALLRLVEKEA